LNVYRGFTPPNAPTYGKVYGGQLVGQALAAASKTVETMKIVHNFHCYFLLVGDINIPIIYDVNRLRDGNNFATRSVDARQKGKTIFTLFASFQVSCYIPEIFHYESLCFSYYVIISE
jgi:acyl-coenzyme A thioesterase 1/2/4